MAVFLVSYILNEVAIKNDRKKTFLNYSFHFSITDICEVENFVAFIKLKIQF